MKNLIIIGLLAFVFATPLGARAQTTAPVTNEQLLEIIQSLMQQVLSLMEQLKKIEATQTASSQTLTAIQTQTAPVQSFGAVAPAGPSISFGEPTCYAGDTSKETANIEAVVGGNEWAYGQVKTGNGGVSFEKSSGSKFNFQVPNNKGDTTLITTFGTVKPTKFNNYTFPATHTFTDTVFVGDVCQ